LQSLDSGCAFSDDLPERNGRIKRRARHSNRSWRTLPVFRLASQSDDRRRRNEPKFCLSHRQRAAAARGKAVMVRPQRDCRPCETFGLLGRTWSLAVARFSAITFLIVVHRTVLAALFAAGWLLRRKRDRAHHCN